MVIYDLGFNNFLNKPPLFNVVPTAAQSGFTGGVNPTVIQSGQTTANLSMISGYFQSNNFFSGIQGWRIDGAGNIEANNGTFRGTLYASSGLIGGFTITATKLYGGRIQTSENVEVGDSGVVMDTDGIRGYSTLLGQTFNIPTDGSAPTFASGIINSTVFNINESAVLRTSSTVGDGSADSMGILINNAALYLCGPNQTLAQANIILSAVTGDGYYKGAIEASNISGSEISGSNIIGTTITGGLIRTAASGQRLEITADGIALLSGAVTNTYNSFDYNDGTKYGTGVLAYVNNVDKVVPFYISTEQTVGDFHFYNRTSTPSGAAEPGDVAVKDEKIIICTTAGTPGTWKVVPAATPQTGYTTFTNISTDRTCDANATTVDELADILGTLIVDLKATGIISA